MGNAGYRQIHPEIWDDPFILDLTPDEKLLFIYMFSNARTSLCGLYEISIKQIMFHTGLEEQCIISTIEKFEQAGKIINENHIYFVVNQFKRHFSRSPKVIARINIDIEAIHDCKPKEVCIQKYEELYGYQYPIHIVSGKAVYSTDTETHKIRKDKIRSNKDENEDEVVATDNNAPQDLINTFTDYAKLKSGSNAEKIAADLVSAGVICEDIIKAVDFLNGSDKHKCVRFTSLEESAIIEMNKRKGKEKIPDQEDPNRYTEGEYGDIGIHQ